ncbi:hypothetical protein LUX12_09685 [Streptomyces somaliensis]|uniref:hypothetical protein n=1 Tax=Streptomyces somaliensis TaxID=78355 RepID=UPI0020CF971A|nr:hypothetical protein [Streptomyces somaliensis]MCP9944992.1 hypothetical protein [Streptomyces somaliensis]MCP9961785.1 hypothetical protein [Streptomyces somaliensis]MCP9974604.1 hypothetical protein [Streptomyces somaliensis]
MLVALPGFGQGEVAEGLVSAQAAAVVEGLDEGEDLDAVQRLLPAWLRTTSEGADDRF